MLNTFSPLWLCRGGKKRHYDVSPFLNVVRGRRNAYDSRWDTGRPFRGRPGAGGRGSAPPLPRPQAHFILPHLNESAIFLSFHLQNASEGTEGGERGVGG